MSKLYKGAKVWVHPKYGGDDYQVDLTFNQLYTKKESEKIVKDALRVECSAVFDDYSLVEGSKSNHNCSDHTVPIKIDVHGHGWKCGICGKFFQADFYEVKDG